MDQEQWATHFQDAAIDPSRWLSSLDLLASRTGSQRAQIVGYGGERSRPFNFITRFCEREISEYSRIDGDNIAGNFRILADRISAPDEIVAEARYREARRMCSVRDYADFCEEFESPFGCQTGLIRGNGELIGMAVLRSRSDGETTEADRATFRLASIAARTAVRMQTAMEQQGASLLVGALDAMSIACFLIDAGGRVSAMTPAAEATLAAGSLHLVDRRLSAVRHGDQQTMALAMAQVLAPAGRVAHRRVLVSGHVAPPARPLPVRIDLFRLYRREWSFGFEPCVAAIVRTRSGGGDHAALLGAGFGLTSAESAVATLLWQGLDRHAIAVRRGVSIETLRVQIKSLFAKTACNREGELIALLHNILD